MASPTSDLTSFACSDRHHIVHSATDRFCWPSSAGIAKAAVVMIVACLQVFTHPFDSVQFKSFISWPDPSKMASFVFNGMKANSMATVYPVDLFVWITSKSYKSSCTNEGWESYLKWFLCREGFFGGGGGVVVVLFMFMVKQKLLHCLVTRYLMMYFLYVGMGRESSKLYIVMILADLDLYWLSVAWEHNFGVCCLANVSIDMGRWACCLNLLGCGRSC